MVIPPANVAVVPSVVAIHVDDAGEAVRDDVQEFLSVFHDDGALVANLDFG